MSRVYRFELTGRGGDTAEFMYTQHYQTDLNAGNAEPSPGDVLDAVLDHYSASGHNLSKIAAVTGNNSVLTRAVVREEVLQGSLDLPVTAEESLSVAGVRSVAAGADIMPTPVCAWLHDTTGVASRSARGGTHAPPAYLPADLNSSGQWDSGSAYWAALVALAATRLDDLDGVFTAIGHTGSLRPVVYSRTRRIRGQDPFTFPVTECTVSPKVRWLRRRESGRGA